MQSEHDRIALRNSISCLVQLSLRPWDFLTSGSPSCRNPCIRFARKRSGHSRPARDLWARISCLGLARAGISAPARADPSRYSAASPRSFRVTYGIDPHIGLFHTPVEGVSDVGEHDFGQLVDNSLIDSTTTRPIFVARTRVPDVAARQALTDFCGLEISANCQPVISALDDNAIEICEAHRRY